MQVGPVLSEAWALYTRFLGRFVLTAAIVFVVLDLLSAIGASASDNVGSSVVWAIVGILVGLVGFFWVQGALAEAVRDVRDGRIDVSIGDLYARARPRLPALISAGVVAGLALAISFVTIILIPLFLYLLARWLFIIPAIVLEGRSAGESFGRSSEVGAGHRWAVLGLALVTLLLYALTTSVIRGLVFFLPTFLENWLGNLVAHSLVAPFVLVAWTIAYYHLIGAGRAPAVDPALR